MSWLILVKVKKNDTLLLATNPTFLIITVSLLKIINKFNLEILVHDVFPENLVPAGLIEKNSLKFRILSKIYNYSFSNADRLIVLGEDMEKLMIKKVFPKKIRIDIIPNWADDEIEPIENFDVTSYLSIALKNKIIFGFTGNLGRVQGLLEFIDLFKNSKNPNIVLVIIGDGAVRSAVEDRIKNEGIKNIYYLGSKPRSEQKLFLNACTIGLVTLKQGMKGLGVPSKTYNLMAAGRPLLYIGDNDSEIDNYIKKYNCGWSFGWEQMEEIESFINKISCNDLELLTEKGMNSKNAVESHYKKEDVLSLY